MLNEKEIDKLMTYVDDELGENSDLFDFPSEIDCLLSFEENKAILKEKIALFKEKSLKAQVQDYEDTLNKYQKMTFEGLDLSKVFKKHDIVGVAGNRNTGKSLLVLSHLKAIRATFPKVPIYVLGVEESLKTSLKTLNISILESTYDILDLQIRNSIIYIDEFALLFSTKKQDKEQDKLMRFFDRISHLNDKLIISTAREGFWNKFMCSRVTAFLVKQIEYDALVNGSWLKRSVEAITSNSDYRLEVEKDKYYYVAQDEITSKYSFEYDEILDSKKGNKNIFGSD